MKKEELNKYISEGRVIESKKSKIFFWEEKDKRIKIELENGMYLFADGVDTTGDKIKFFSYSAEKGKYIMPTLYTDSSLDDLEVWDTIIGRVFQYAKDECTFLFAFAHTFDNYGFGNDMYDVMKFNDEGESQHQVISGSDFHKMMKEGKIIPYSDASASIEKLSEFIDIKVKEL